MKDGSVYKYHGNTKGVYLYPVKRNFREIIGCVERPNRTFELERERVKLKMMLQSNEWQPDLLKEAGLTEEEIPKLADELYNYCESFKKYLVWRIVKYGCKVVIFIEICNNDKSIFE